MRTRLIHISISALPPDTPLADLGALAAYDLNKLPDARKLGEDIIREIQQELMMRVSSAETAVVPEKDAQCLMVGVSWVILLLHFLYIFQSNSKDINRISFIASIFRLAQPWKLCPA